MGGETMPDGTLRGAVDICPGYLIARPQVIEAARAHKWWSKGMLETRFRKPSDVLMDGVEIIDGAIASVEAYALEQAAKPGGQHGSA